MTNAISPLPTYPASTFQLSSNRDFDLDTSLNVDDDLLDDLGRSVKTGESSQHLSHISPIQFSAYSIKRL